MHFWETIWTNRNFEPRNPDRVTIQEGKKVIFGTDSMEKTTVSNKQPPSWLVKSILKKLWASLYISAEQKHLSNSVKLTHRILNFGNHRRTSTYLEKVKAPS